MNGEPTGEAPKGDFQFSTPIATAPQSTDSEIRKENDRMKTASKEDKIKALFENLSEIPLRQVVKEGDGKELTNYSLAERMEAIFQDSAFVVGTEAAREEMAHLTKRVIKEKETTQAWDSASTHVLLSQLVEKEVIPPVSALERLKVFPQNTLRQASLLLRTAMEKK